MINRWFIFLLLFLNIWFYKVNAQIRGYENRRVGDEIKGDWSFGLGINVIDDGGVILGALSNPKKYAHFNRPVQIQTEYFFNNLLSLSPSISFNKYVEGKTADRRGVILRNEEPGYFAVDIASKFYFRDILQNYVIEPYAFLGFGYTNIKEHIVNPYGLNIPGSVEVDANGQWKIPEIGYMTVNAGVGANYWFSRRWGVNLHIAGKWGVRDGKHEDIISNQIQLSIAALYLIRHN